MAFDFPSSPTLNQVYTSGGVTYVYNGQGWTLQPSFDPTEFVLKAGDTMSGSLSIIATTPVLDVRGTAKEPQIHVASANNDAGGYIEGYDDSTMLLSAGVKYSAAAGGWQAKATSASIIVVGGGTVTLYGNTGLTVGSVYTPTASYSQSPTLMTHCTDVTISKSAPLLTLNGASPQIILNGSAAP